MNKAMNKNNLQYTSFRWNKITDFCFVVQEIKSNNFEMEDLINDQIPYKESQLSLFKLDRRWVLNAGSISVGIANC